MSCDLLVASEGARFGTPEGRIGLIGATSLVPVIGWQWAKFLIMTGELLDARRARDIDLALTVLPDDELLERCRDLARRIARMPSDAVFLNRRAVDAVADAMEATGIGAGRDHEVLTLANAGQARARDGRALREILDDDILAGPDVPLTWIWVYFTPTAPTAELRADGHPRSTGFGPLAGLDRRMFVGGDLERQGPVRLGVATHRTGEITGAEHKEGSTGQFVLVGVEHTYRQGGEVVLSERQQILYRRAPSNPVNVPGPPVDVPVSEGVRRELRPDERLLFRYSALTFNTHRIHYDHGYATDAEGYPGLVVHGPLTATLLADLAAEQLGAALTSFSFRATAPAFVGVTIWFLVEHVEDGSAAVRAVPTTASLSCRQRRSSGARPPSVLCRWSRPPERDLRHRSLSDVSVAGEVALEPVEGPLPGVPGGGLVVAVALVAVEAVAGLGILDDLGRLPR